MSEFKQRRADLVAKIGSDAAVVIPAAPMRYRSRDVEYPFRQDSDFYYFSGFEEPEAVAVLVGGQYVLFCRARDPDAEVWTGKRSGLEGAVSEFGADQAFNIDQFPAKIKTLLAGCSNIFTTNAKHPGCEDFNDITDVTSDMRLIKSPFEISRIRRAIEISISAHSRAMRYVEPDMMEYALEAEINHEFTRSGASSPAYGTIVGGGENSCILHYVDNNKPLKSGDLVLVDAGAEYDYYAADITRTYPVNGKFTDDQKTIYDIVLNAQLAVIDHVKPGARWDELQKIAVKVITQGLVDLDILSGDVDELVKQEKYKQFYMHGSGHWMGMDVHDAGRYKLDDEPIALKPGMVFTVEPGIYIAAADNVDKRWHNIGVRIEDDVLVTEGGVDVLSAALPKTVDDIELLMAQKT